jgi:beta-galactosidase
MVGLLLFKKNQTLASPPKEGQEIFKVSKFSKGWVTSSFLFALLQLFFLIITHAQPRQVIDFNSGWKFYLGNDSTAKETGYDDTKWRSLSLPHDWSIESDFIKDAQATNQGGSLPGGIGWYRKKFTVSASAKNKMVSIEFDGVYKNSEIWINGIYLGKRPNGYVNFSYDLTPYLFFNNKNLIAVKVDNNQQPDSRWYTGSGIYRDVKLVIKNQISLGYNGYFITPGLFSKNIGQWNFYNHKDTGGVFGNIHFTSLDINNFTAKNEKVEVEFILKNRGGVVLNRTKHEFKADSLWGGRFGIDGTDGLWGVNNPVLWSPANPYLYFIEIKLYSKGKIVDETSTSVGFRKAEFHSARGFYLNDLPLKLKGVCMHHDLGALGAAFNITAAKRQLRILKEMGCNSIRFSHNPPASEMLDLCDEMGFLVIDEAFDMWKKKKNKYDYHNDFTEWHKRDLEAMIYRDRNHPSVIAWSIGNEIREQFDSTGTTITKELVDIVKAIDPTRPVISALTETLPEKNFIAKAGALDILGFNYKDYDYKNLAARFPNMPFIATETASAIATRGVYQYPSDSIRIWPPDYKAQDTFSAGNKDYTGPSYDNTKAYWGNTHEKSWLAVKNNEHIAGAFVWSGFDYLGEPLPYPKFPARSSYFGIIDLAGFPKDVYYMYQSEWSSKNVLHLFPHWSWNKGDTVDVWAYYNNADEVELFINNKSVGKRIKTDSTLHVMWRIPFEPGIVKAVSKKKGKTVLTKEIKTADKPVRIELIADRKIIRADGKDLLFITVRVLDKNGILVPDAENLIQFSISGTGKITGTDNGYQADTVSLKSTKRKAWKGLALAIIKSSGKKGNITLKAIGAGLQPAIITLKISD